MGTTHRTPVPEVDIETLASAMTAGGIVVDIRERSEHTTGYVPGALLMPMGEVAARVGELDPTVPIYVICATGNRSLAVTDALIGAGFDAYSVAGGTSAWKASGRAVTVDSPAGRGGWSAP